MFGAATQRDPVARRRRSQRARSPRSDDDDDERGRIASEKSSLVLRVKHSRHILLVLLHSRPEFWEPADTLASPRRDGCRRTHMLVLVLVACAAAATGGISATRRLGALPLTAADEDHDEAHHDPCGLAASPAPSCELTNSTSLVCAGGITSDHLSGSSELRSLTLCAWPVPRFEPVVVATLFPSLRQLSLVASGVSRLLSDFPAFQDLQMLNLSGLHLRALEDSTFSRLEKLRVLDLRSNNLSHLRPEVLSGLPSLDRVYLDDNPWNCQGNMTWLADGPWSRRVVDRDKATCGDQQYQGKPLRSVMAIVKAMEDGCPRGPPLSCSCTLEHIVWNLRQRYLVPNIVVNCSHLGLVQMPHTLPVNTTTLHVEGNQISDLMPLVTNPIYRTVLDIYLDGNVLESLEALEGSQWLAGFRAFSVRDNRLSQMPTYALYNALQKNPNVLVIFLGGNPWKCDCVFTPAFQDLLMKYTTLVKDIGDVKCSLVEGDENSLLPIVEVSRSALCIPPNKYFIQPLDLLNGVLALLIVFVIGKLVYDYWNFKKTGRVPWIVTKMP